MNYPSERKSPTRLNADEKYAVYKYCVENYALKQVDDMTTFWVEPHKIAKEINQHYSKIVSDKTITPQHVKDAVEYSVAWQRRLDKLPVQPIETAELEQLRIYKNKTVREVEELKIAIEDKDNAIHKLRNENARLTNGSARELEATKQKLERIRAIVSVS